MSSFLDKINEKIPDNNNGRVKPKSIREAFQITEQKINELSSGVLGNITTTQTLAEINVLPDGVYQAQTSGTYANGLIAKESYLTRFRKVGTAWALENETQLPNETTSKINIESELPTSSEAVVDYIPKEAAINIFDKDDVVLDMYADSDGNLSPASGWFVSVKIPIVENTDYVKINCAVAIYNEANVMLSRQTTSTISFKSDIGAKYIRVTSKIEELNIAMVIKGTVLPTSYISGKKQISKELIPRIEAKGLVVKDEKFSVSGNEVFNYVPKENNSSNLFDYEDVVFGKYIDENGNLADADGWFAGGKIPVTGYGKYSKLNCAGAFYNELDMFISRITASIQVFDAPGNARYFRVTDKVENLKKAMFQKGYDLSVPELGNKKISENILPPSVLARKGNNIIISKNGGGNFRHINDALDWLKNNKEDSVNNPFTFEIIDGIYTESVDICGMYVSLIGRNRENCIIRTFTNDYYHPPIDMACNNHLSNLTIIADDDGVTTPVGGVNGMSAYGIHFDVSGRYEPMGAKVQGASIVKNCLIIGKHQHAVGQGLWTNQYSIWDDCEFYSPTRPAFRSHSYMPAGATNQRFLMRNCRIHNAGTEIPIYIQDPNIAEGKDNLDTIYSFQNNIAWNDNGQTGNAMLWTHELIGDGDLSGRIKLGKDSFGNNIPRLNK